MNTVYALWSSRGVELPTPTSGLEATRIHDNIIGGDFETNSGVDVEAAIIIKNIPDTSVKDIQSLVFYNRSSTFQERAEGLAI